MWLADRWKEYAVLDASDGERLEKWADYLLVRPDPQVIWSSEKTGRGWEQPHARYFRSKSGGGNWKIRSLPESWPVHYELSSGTLTFHLKPFSFKHTGLFPEQAVNWDWAEGLIRERKTQEPEREIKVLNLFAYTGGATCACAKAGASVTHVDASKGMVTWAHENAVSSGLTDAPIRYLVDDCMKFVQREIRRGNHYDAIIMDPPSYGRGPKGEIWKLEEKIYPFLGDCVKLLSERPLFVLLNAYTTGLQPGVLTYLLSETLKGKGAQIVSEELGLPVRSTGLALPCGASGRAVF